MRFVVYAKAQDAGWGRDWFWAPRDEEPTVRDEHGPYPLKLWAWLAGAFAWVCRGGSV